MFETQICTIMATHLRVVVQVPQSCKWLGDFFVRLRSRTLESPIDPKDLSE
jgi:hypothetical protein